jgi:hypothetical protein
MVHLVLALLIFLAVPAQSGALRVALFHTDLERKGPGLLLRDIAKGDDPQINAVMDVITAIQPDVLLLLDFDYDLNGQALSALRQGLAQHGADYPHQFARRPNTGLQSGIDLDGDGALGRAGDAQGFGHFSGQGGMALLSRFPIMTDAAQDFSALLWRDLPNAQLPVTDAGPFPSAAAQAIQRLSTTGHWVIPIDIGQRLPLHILAYHAGPPVFDGPENRNGLRNADETRFWMHYLDGSFTAPPAARFVLMGGANQSPQDPAMHALLQRPDLQDPRPRSPGSQAQAGNPFHTVFWPPPGPGARRVDYVLPSADWTITGAGVHRPLGDKAAATASRHRLVWVDLAL